MEELSGGRSAVEITFRARLFDEQHERRHEKPFHNKLSSGPDSGRRWNMLRFPVTSRPSPCGSAVGESDASCAGGSLFAGAPR